jgi:hypothetical protein
VLDVLFIGGGGRMLLLEGSKAMSTRPDDTRVKVNTLGLLVVKPWDKDSYVLLLLLINVAVIIFKVISEARTARG